MVKSVIALIVFGLIAVSILVMVIINFMYRGLRKTREAVEESRYRSQKRKEQKEKNPFGDDYFKSSGGSRQTRKKGPTQYEQRQQEPRQQASSQQARQSQQAQQAQAEAKQDTARRTTTSSGVTIIDDRDTEEKRKIFDHSDGEYVEFEEV